MKRISKTLNLQREFKAAHQKFAKDEDGAVLVFALFLFVLMVMMGGLAVDLMRYETTRTTLQNTLDRSTLAASSLSQDLDPAAVVQDYFTKAGVAEYLTSVDVQTGLNFRSVEANALADAKPLFLHLLGINGLKAPGNAKAEQRINNVEVMLVLDVSGSMAGTKITNLKSAASEFVSTVLLSDADDRISVGLVPYNGQVNLGPTLAGKYNVTLPTGVANTECVDLPASVYAGTGMSRTVELPTTAYADTYSAASQTTSYVAPSSAAPAAGNRWCPPSDKNIVRLPTNNIASLQSAINGLTAVGATSINAGLKWGLTLLDPSTRPVFAELAGSSAMPSAFSIRPFEYSDPEAMKVIVLMTDGEHFAEERVNTAYKSGMSPIFKGSDDNYSIRHTSGRPTAAGANEYFVPHLCVTTNCKSGANTAEAWRSTKWSNGTQQSWQQVWASMRVSYVAWQMYERALGKDSNRGSTYYTWFANFRSQTATSDMDNQLQAVCAMAKSKPNITVYGIAFDAPTPGQQQIKMCTSGYDSTNPSADNPFFFASQPENIKTAFRAIATNITQLRLTQ